MQRIKNNIKIKDGSLIGRTLDSNNKEEMKRAREFRHRIFLDELGWSLPEGTVENVDKYDGGAVHFGAFSDTGELLGYFRLVLSENGFMIEREFASLIYPDYCVRKEKDTVEASHFAISRRLRGEEDGFRVIGLLLRTLYLWAKNNNVRYIYGVCASDYLKFLEGLFSGCKSIGPAYEYQKGVSSSALIFDLEKLDLPEIQVFWSLVIDKSRIEQ